MIDYYEILEVSPNASPEVIREVYKFLLHRYNLAHDSEDQSEAQKLHFFHLAYDVLSDPDKRQIYDEELNKIRSIHHEYARQPDSFELAAENEAQNSEADTHRIMNPTKKKVEISNQTSILSRLKWNRWGWAVSILAVVVILISMVQPDPEKALQGQLALQSHVEKKELEDGLQKNSEDSQQIIPVEKNKEEMAKVKSSKTTATDSAP